MPLNNSATARQSPLAIANDTVFNGYLFVRYSWHLHHGCFCKCSEIAPSATRTEYYYIVTIFRQELSSSVVSQVAPQSSDKFFIWGPLADRRTASASASAEDARLLDKLPYAECAKFNHYSRDGDTLCLSNTRTEVLADIMAWARGCDTPKSASTGDDMRKYPSHLLGSVEWRARASG